MSDDQDLVLAALTRDLVERFAPERIVLFGSRARGDHHPSSDYDVMMVLGDSQLDVMAVRRVVQEIHTNVDIFVSPREAFEHRRTDVGTLEHVADQDGQVLYARPGLPAAPRVRETPSEAGESLQEWIDRARDDFTAMTALAQSTASGIRGAIVFHAHQSVEKMLKTALVAHRVRPPRTHELTDLLSRLPIELRDQSPLGEVCRGLQALWPNARYPHEPMPTSEQVDQAVAWARQARELLNRVIVPRSF